MSISQSVRAAERALDILLCFTRDKPILSLTEISEQIGMHKSTIHRLLATLESKRFITRDKSTGLYQLGFLFVEFASTMLNGLDVQRWALPYLQQLSIQCGETVDLAILNNDHVVYLQVVESSNRIKIAAAVGQHLPTFCTATGKAFLAFLSEDQVRAILKQGMTRYTQHTLVSHEEIYQNLRQAKERGVAISQEEYEIDINAVAAPIMDANGYPIAAVAMVGPSYRMSFDRMMEIGQMIKNTTGKIEREVGMGFKAAAVLTDMPRIPDKPIDFGLQSFCQDRKICAENCPSKAISTGYKVMYNGYETWKLDTRRCASFNFTNNHGTMCNRSVKVCPWSNPPTFGHNIVRELVMHSHLAQRIAIQAAYRLGQGKSHPEDKWWFDFEYIGDSIRIAEMDADQVH